jgi:hypothetical protein
MGAKQRQPRPLPPPTKLVGQVGQVGQPQRMADLRSGSRSGTARPTRLEQLLSPSSNAPLTTTYTATAHDIGQQHGSGFLIQAGCRHTRTIDPIPGRSAGCS